MSDLSLREDRMNHVEKDTEKTSLHVADPEILELEAKLALYCGTKHAVACASARDALLMALMSYDVGPGDAVLTTPFNDSMAVSAIRELGATPIFVDIDQSTFNIDPEHLEPAIEAVLKGDSSVYPLPVAGEVVRLKLRGIVSSDLFGLPADYDTINAIATKYGLFVIEDGSQALGGLYKGRRVGSLADIGFTSFAEGAPLEAAGNGGMCFTDQDHLAEWMRAIRTQETSKNGEASSSGTVSRHMDPLQAVALLAKFAMLPEEIRLRQKFAALYTKYLDENPLLITPYVPDGVVPVWSRYCLMTESDEERAVMLKKLRDEGIAAGMCYAKPLYLLEEFSDLKYREGDFPISEDYAMRTFRVPLHSSLTGDDQEKVADLLNDWE